MSHPDRKSGAQQQQRKKKKAKARAQAKRPSSIQPDNTGSIGEERRGLAVSPTSGHTKSTRPKAAPAAIPETVAGAVKPRSEPLLARTSEKTTKSKYSLSQIYIPADAEQAPPTGSSTKAAKSKASPPPSRVHHQFPSIDLGQAASAASVGERSPSDVARMTKKRKASALGPADAKRPAFDSRVLHNSGASREDVDKLSTPGPDAVFTPSKRHKKKNASKRKSVTFELSATESDSASGALSSSAFVKHDTATDEDEDGLDKLPDPVRSPLPRAILKTRQEKGFPEHKLPDLEPHALVSGRTRGAPSSSATATHGSASREDEDELDELSISPPATVPTPIKKHEKTNFHKQEAAEHDNVVPDHADSDVDTQAEDQLPRHQTPVARSIIRPVTSKQPESTVEKTRDIEETTPVDQNAPDERKPKRPKTRERVTVLENLIRDLQTSKAEREEELSCARAQVSQLSEGLEDMVQAKWDAYKDEIKDAHKAEISALKKSFEERIAFGDIQGLKVVCEEVGSSVGEIQADLATHEAKCLELRDKEWKSLRQQLEEGLAPLSDIQGLKIAHKELDRRVVDIQTALETHESECLKSREDHRASIENSLKIAEGKKREEDARRDERIVEMFKNINSLIQNLRTSMSDREELQTEQNTQQAAQEKTWTTKLEEECQRRQSQFATMRSQIEDVKSSQQAINETLMRWKGICDPDMDSDRPATIDGVKTQISTALETVNEEISSVQLQLRQCSAQRNEQQQGEGLPALKGLLVSEGQAEPSNKVSHEPENLKNASMVAQSKEEQQINDDAEKTEILVREVTNHALSLLAESKKSEQVPQNCACMCKDQIDGLESRNNELETEISRLGSRLGSDVGTMLGNYNEIARLMRERPGHIALASLQNQVEALRVDVHNMTSAIHGPLRPALASGIPHSRVPEPHVAPRQIAPTNGLNRPLSHPQLSTPNAMPAPRPGVLTIQPRPPTSPCQVGFVHQTGTHPVQPMGQSNVPSAGTAGMSAHACPAAQPRNTTSMPPPARPNPGPLNAQASSPTVPYQPLSREGGDTIANCNA